MLWSVGDNVFDGDGGGEGSSPTGLRELQFLGEDVGTADEDADVVFLDGTLRDSRLGVLCLDGPLCIEESWPLRVCGHKKMRLLAVPCSW